MPVIGLHSIAGAPLLLIGLGLLLLAGPRTVFLITIAAAVPLSTIGWDFAITQIGGRTLDTRLLITFGVATLIGLALLIDRPRLGRLGALLAGFVAYVVLDGLLRSDSMLTWAPPATRWFSYAGILILARAHLRETEDVRWLSGAVVAACGVLAALGILQFLVGEASFINGALRATGPGGRGPISLAFAGQMMLILGYGLAMAYRPTRRASVAATVLGTVAIVASATRLITVTAWLAVTVMSAVGRRWRLVAIVAVVFASSLVIRPDLLGRFVGTIPIIDMDRAPGEPESGEGDEMAVDASLAFRFFIWGAILTEWQVQPLLGIGPGMTAPTVAAISPAERTAPHNDYIGILAELGIVGLTLFLAVQLAIVTGLFRAWRCALTPEAHHLSLAVLLTFVTFNILGALNNPAYFFDMQVPIWALAGSTLALAPQLSRPKGEAAEPALHAEDGIGDQGSGRPLLREGNIVNDDSRLP
ncbi:MAG: O-antigen ligase family protein [Candidatus Limnocylindria bacterium]